MRWVSSESERSVHGADALPPHLQYKHSNVVPVQRTYTNTHTHTHTLGKESANSKSE